MSKTKSITCFVAALDGDIQPDTATWNAQWTRQKVGEWHITEDGMTWQDGWKSAKKNGYRIIKVKVSKAPRPRP